MPKLIVELKDPPKILKGRNLSATRDGYNWHTIRMETKEEAHRIIEVIESWAGRHVCEWELNQDCEYELWETDCNETFCFTDGTPADNRMKFCCYCGGELKVKERISE